MNAQRNKKPGREGSAEGEEAADHEASPFSLSPKALATPILIAFNLAVFFGMLVDGMPIRGSPSIDSFVAWGASFGPLTLAGEWWRLIACTFVHESPAHLIPNLLGLWFGGSLLERRIGSANFLAIYLVSALGSSLASLTWNPGTVAFGASGAVLGVLGALAILSFRKPSFVQPTPAISPFTMAITILVATAALGFFAPNVDHAGHLGGLLAGCTIAVVLNGFSVPETTRRSGLRAVAVSAGCLLLLGFIAYNLPRHIIAVDNEFQRFHAVQNHLVSQIKRARDQRNGEEIDLVRFRDLLAEQIVPLSRAARGRIEILEYIPPAYDRHREAVLAAALDRERLWQTYIEQATRIETILSRIGQLEQQIASDYAQIQDSVEKGALPRHEIAQRLFESTVDSWKPLILDMQDDAELYEGLRERLEILRTYALLRQRAWELSAQSVSEDAPSLGVAAREEHRRARELVAPWIED